MDCEPRREPHTGIIYTPPLFSDHVAVSLLLSNASLSKPLLDGKACADSLSLQAMPYKRQRRLQDMFAARPKSRVADSRPAGARVGAGVSQSLATAAVLNPAAGAVPTKRLGSTSEKRLALGTAAATVGATKQPTKKRKPGQQGIASFFSSKQ